ncbi:MAG: HTH domain-containing protein, partial [Chloroflexota bacterium]
MSTTTVRLLAVLELLQSRDEITGAEIAERLKVDRRSVRRYIKAIQEMGIPVEAERGRYGAYRLERGYKLPPLMFTEEEIVALTLGLMMIRAYRFPLNPSSIAGALAKIERTIPTQFLDQLRAIEDTVHFNPVAPPTDIDMKVIEKVAIATRTRHRVRIVY